MVVLRFSKGKYCVASVAVYLSEEMIILKKRPIHIIIGVGSRVLCAPRGSAWKKLFLVQQIRISNFPLHVLAQKSIFINILVRTR